MSERFQWKPVTTRLARKKPVPRVVAGALSVPFRHSGGGGGASRSAMFSKPITAWAGSLLEERLDVVRRLELVLGQVHVVLEAIERDGDFLPGVVQLNLVGDRSEE